MITKKVLFFLHQIDKYPFEASVINIALVFAYYWSLGMKMEPPNKDSFFLSLAFCIEAYNMNLDGTVSNIEGTE